MPVFQAVKFWGGLLHSCIATIANKYYSTLKLSAEAYNLRHCKGVSASGSGWHEDIFKVFLSLLVLWLCMLEGAVLNSALLQPRLSIPGDRIDR